mgnify:FL=1
MIQERFVGNHYECGFRFGSLLAERGNFILEQIPFSITEERLQFAAACLPVYKKYFPKILEEIRGIAEGQRCPAERLQAVLFSMYAMPPACRCSCFAVSNGTEILFGRNSDFLTELQDNNRNVQYCFSDGSHAFYGNTTSFVQMEDGVNEKGLAAGLTSVYPPSGASGPLIAPGMNAGLLLRFFLERCASVEEALAWLKRLPVSSAQTFTLADAGGKIAVAECFAGGLKVIRPEKETMRKQAFACATNLFYSEELKRFNEPGIDTWEAGPRYQTMQRALEAEAGEMVLSDALDLLSGRKGFLCQYDRRTGKDTVWSVVYDLKRRKIYEAYGNPSRCEFVETAF